MSPVGTRDDVVAQPVADHLSQAHGDGPAPAAPGDGNLKARPVPDLPSKDIEGTLTELSRRGLLRRGVVLEAINSHTVKLRGNSGVVNETATSRVRVRDMPILTDAATPPARTTHGTHVHGCLAERGLTFRIVSPDAG